MAQAYLALGSNLGDRAANLAAAREGLARLPSTTLLKTASVYETLPVGGPEGQGMFLNSAALVRTELPPHDFLRELHALERRVGRLRENETVRWGPRVIDIDILLWDDEIIDDETLTIPHPRMAERLFVLLPLAELDRDARHPVLNATAGELLTRLQNTHENNGTDEPNEGIRRLPL